jgi:cobalt-zinc-cadmium efflux system outer membrane protein
MRKAIAITTAWLLTTASQAQTLGAALEQAWSRHPQAQVFAAHEAQAQARAELAAALTPAPAKMSLSNASDRLNQATGKDAWELEVAVPLWLPGQKAAQGQEAQSNQSELAARRAALRLQLAAEVREAWWALALARNALDSAQRREATATALQADVQRQLKAGELARAQANLADLERLGAEGETLEALTSVAQAEQAYRTLTGAGAPAQLAEEAPASPPTVPSTHPQLMAAQAVVQMAQARLGVAQQTGRDAPELALRWVRDRGDASAAYADSVGIKLTVPFGSSARLRQESAGALAETLQADAELALVQQRLQLESERAQREAKMVALQLTKAQVRVTLTADTLRLTEKSYALGESDLGSLLRARAAALDAQANLSRQTTARAASISRLNQSMGVMP